MAIVGTSWRFPKASRCPGDGFGVRAWVVPGVRTRRATDSFEVRQFGPAQEQADRTGLARFPCDETLSVQGHDHLVDRRGADPEVPLHVGLGGRDAVELGVVVDEGEELA